MSIEKKSLISNRVAVKKAKLTKASATKGSSTKVGKILVSPQCHTNLKHTCPCPLEAKRHFAEALGA